MAPAKLMIVEDEFIVATNLQADLEDQGYVVVEDRPTPAKRRWPSPPIGDRTWP